MRKSELKAYRARENELYYTALDRFLNKTDWDISEWLYENEWKEYKDIRALLDDPID